MNFKYIFFVSLTGKPVVASSLAEVFLVLLVLLVTCCLLSWCFLLSKLAAVAVRSFAFGVGFNMCGVFDLRLEVKVGSMVAARTDSACGVVWRKRDLQLDAQHAQLGYT